MKPTTERRFLASTLAAYGSQLGRLLIRAAGDLVLARLILPTGHGLFDLALGVVMIGSILRDLGLPYQLIRDPRRPVVGRARVGPRASPRTPGARTELGRNSSV